MSTSDLAACGTGPDLLVRGVRMLLSSFLLVFCPSSRALYLFTTLLTPCCDSQTWRFVTSHCLWVVLSPILTSCLWGSFFLAPAFF
ncbi:hypothetical protein IWZ00DRAFT_494452 [Phyllosticta capitalensis]|uniref:uncharacterized protein n=1 Tax=Phyllosticta capitalensis TaxID=121624 RepID=UPI00312F0BBC